MSSDEEIESFIGPNAQYYLKRFRVFAAEGCRYYNVNMSAALFSYVWVAYRRMYKVLPLIVVIDLACLGLAPILLQLAQLVSGTPGRIVVI